MKKPLMLKVNIMLYYVALNKYLKSLYLPKLDYDIIKSHHLYFIKVSSRHNVIKLQNMANTSVVISAAVTAYARMHMNKIKLFFFCVKLKNNLCSK